MTAYAVFTISRDDIVALSRAIARVIPQNFMNDPDRPVQIGVSGSIRSGKKIVADFGRAQILGISGDNLGFAKQKKFLPEADLRDIFNTRSYVAAGQKEYDEFVLGKCKGDIVEVSFINMSWRCGYSFPYYKSAKRRAYSDIERVAALREGFKAYREYGGVSYVHNAQACGFDFDLAVRIEDECIQRKIQDKKLGIGLMQDCYIADILSHFSTAEHWDEDWLRYVEVEIPNQRLLKDSRLVDVLTHRGFVPKDQLSDDLFLPTDQIYKADDLPEVPLFKP